MYTFQNLLALEDDEVARGEFCRDVVRQHMSSDEYKQAQIADEYYHKHEPTIERAMKFFYTVTGRKQEDPFASNYKLKFLFFRKKVIQHVSYVLNKGIVMDENVKNQLDKRLERKAKKWVKYAMVAGKSYAFFNNGTVDVFHMVSNDYHPGFAPLYDENTSKLAAGIRFWFKRIDNENRLIASLYEVDGITEYVENDDGNMVSENGRIPYIAVKTSNAIEQVTTGRNYGRLPIVECIANDCRESDLVGLREDIDCYEFTKSGLANEIEDLTGFWWAIENAGGMDDPDVAKFIQRMKTVHAAVVDSEGTGGTRVTSHTQEIPYNARDKMLTILKADLYDNANMVDMSQLSAAQKTTQEIQAAYQSQDNYCGDLRDNIIDAIDELLQIAGLPEQNITMEFDKVVNVSETVNAVMAALPLIGEDIAVDILPMLTADQKALIKKQRAADNMPKLENSDDEDDENDDSESDDE